MSEPTNAEVVIARALIETAAKITAAPMSMMTALSLATAVLAALKEEYTEDVEYVMGRILNGDTICDGYCHEFCCSCD